MTELLLLTPNLSQRHMDCWTMLMLTYDSYDDGTGRERVDKVREEVRAEEEAADRSERTHGVHDADVHGGVVALHVVVDVRRSESKQRGAAATKQELNDDDER